MRTLSLNLVIIASAFLVACGGGSGGADSEVVRVVDDTTDQPTNDVVDTPTDDTPDVADVVVPEDVEETEDLVLAPTIELKPTVDVTYSVDLPSAYDGATAVLCVSVDAVPADPSAASLDFSDCVFSGQLEGGALQSDIQLANTAEYVFSAIISSTEDDRVVSWSSPTSGQELLVSL